MAAKFKRTNPAVATGIVTDDAEGVLNPAFGISTDFPRLIEVDIDRVQPNPNQPRRNFTEEALRELAESIARQGLLQPIIVKRHSGGDDYVLAAGERRWRAHQLLGKSTIFAIVTNGDADEIALVENLQRQDLDAFETATGLSRLADRHGYTQEQLGAAVGLSKSEVSRLLALNYLADEIRDGYHAVRDRVSKSHLYLLADAAGQEEQLALWERIRDGATIRDLRAVRRQEPAKPPLVKQPAGLAAAIARMDRSLETMRQSARGLTGEEKRQLTALRERIDEVLRS